MSLFFIDEQRCEGCGTCAAACPMGIINWAGKRALPEPVPGAEKICLNCGHCLAVCPHGALSLRTMKVEGCEKIRWDLLPSFEQLDILIRSRRSIRLYKEDPVPKELLTQLIDTARYAPTARNRQLCDWLVIQGRDQMERLNYHVFDWLAHLLASDPTRAAAIGAKRLGLARKNGLDPILRGAPCLVLVHAPEEYAGGLMDAAISLTTFELAAFAAGLGTCWAGFLQAAVSNWPSLQQALKLPAGRILRAAMMVGFPKVRYKKVPERRPARITWQE